VTLGELLDAVISRLESAGIPYMIVGSLASSYHGLPRSTRDVDVVIDPTKDALEILLSSFDSRHFYVGDGLDALERRGMFYVVDLEGGWKVDFIVKKERPFSESEFARRLHAEVAGMRVMLATADDTVLAKLEWAALGESDRQLADAATVLRVSGDRVDRAYLERWATALGIEELLARALQSD
jgi:hypothetical protein